MITHDIYIDRMEVEPLVGNLSNVVAKAYWQMIFTDGEFISTGSGVTTFDTSTIVDFVAVDQLTEEVVANWVRTDLQNRGFEQELIQYHSGVIEAKNAAKTLVQWNQPLLDSKQRPATTVFKLSN